MRLLVCGGRNYKDRAHVFAALDAVHHKRGVTVLIHGAAPGADALADAWARARGVTVEFYPAEWRIRGPGAGPERNQRMLVEGRPEGVVAFPGGKGTADMVGRAKAAGLLVWHP